MIFNWSHFKLKEIIQYLIITLNIIHMNPPDPKPPPNPPEKPPDPPKPLPG